MDIYTLDYFQELYKHHLDLYQQRRYTPISGLFNRSLCNFYASKLIDLGVLTNEEHQDNLLPLVDFNELLGRKGSIASDGME